ncbi:motility protein A [Thalassospira sp. TSL5-1]|uniref:motility protein A n=1 Tax=Thalassospira sp. TSL5-1 TaxID=1544451 RepID=UPI00093DE45F|nr:MotA/TolQ/ExbB proton channel family protein [Thalassospira sp. TSL5-1]OKH89011.1 flagellar motor protein MotA [Thalassospira sp. TSL5-1]
MADGGTKTTFDIATVVGLIVGFALVIAAVVLGGSPGAFIDVPSILIVIGGTAAITAVCFSLGEFLGIGRVLARTIFHPSRNPSDAALQILQLAEIARKGGVLSLQGHLDSLLSEEYLWKGLSLVVDGTPPEEVEGIMRKDMNATISRHHKGASILKKAGDIAPAMGLIGTLIGLVQMLGNLDDPSSIGPSMAVALLTTFYGAVLSNMVFMPLAAKLERNSQEEELLNSVYMVGAVSIGRQENPRRLEMLLNSILPPAKRVSYFD